MPEFDPSQGCWVQEHLHDQTFAWQPEWEDAYRRNAKLFAYREANIANWDGLLLDGWEPFAGK